jgi:hypothetical protein
MNYYTNEGVVHAELLLVTCLKRKALQGIKPLHASASSGRLSVASGTSKQHQNLSGVGETYVREL